MLLVLLFSKLFRFTKLKDSGLHFSYADGKVMEEFLIQTELV